MGGTGDKEVLSDTVQLCRECHTKITDEIWTLSRDGGRWIVREGGHLLARRPERGIDPSESADWTRVVREQGARVVREIPLIADDEVIIGIYEAALELQTQGFAIECEVVWELYQRAPGKYKEKMGMVGGLLHLSETAVYNRLMSRKAFGQALEALDDVPEMLPTHIQIAATSHDPEHAVEVFKEMADNGPVPVRAFRDAFQDEKCRYRQVTAWCVKKDCRVTDELCKECKC